MRNVTIALVVILAGALASDALAQGRGGRGGRGGFGGGQAGLAALVSIEKVAEDLGLTDDQKSQIQEMRRELRGERGDRGQRGDRGSFRDMSEEERQQMREEFAARRAEQQKAEAEKLGAILDDGQMSRLGEIRIQIQGAAALLNDDVQAKLGLSADTIADLESTSRDAQDEMRSQMREIFSSGDREGFREKMTELRDSMQQKLLDVLTDAEQEQFASLQGEKLDIAPEDLRGGRGGRGGRGEGGQGRRNRGGGGRPELE